MQAKPQKSGSVVELERQEAKYVIHPSRVAAVRDFIRPFVMPDPNAEGYPPEYTVTTLQLDSSAMTLYRAKEEESLNRFKLRIRTYDSVVGSPIFLEIKRKLNGVVSKSRATIDTAKWGPMPFLDPNSPITLKSDREHWNYLEFIRLVKEIGARPIVKVRYHRESYLGTNDNYARVTFDRKMCYQPSRSWNVFEDDGRWWNMDVDEVFHLPYSGVILELKAFNEAPLWMLDLAHRFDLVRVGFCKYFSAVRLESLFSGTMYSDTSETCVVA
tara:strand:+ start:4161 stop:4973 length:813 start_codon:yes stop_codon:yes gene_type:complete